jgi:hypothetical protein
MALPRVSESIPPPAGASFPETEGERSAVRQALERILAHPLFANSRRYPKLLRYVVEKTLDDPSEALKERTLGVQVFGREPDYDTNLDHVVRTTAGEVRKRLQQYYLEEGQHDGVIIELPAGSYVPTFRVAPAPALLESPPAARKTSRVRWLVLACVVLALGVAVALLAPRSWRPAATASDRFWAPVLASPNSAVLCIGSAQRAIPMGSTAASSEETLTLFDLHRSEREKVAFSDALTMARLAGLLRAKDKQFHIRQEASATLADLTEGPAILIGAFDNDWTLRLTGPLRYRFEFDTVRQVSLIRDRQNPLRADWTVDWSMPYLQFGRDYAIVSRVLDRTTKQPVVVAAGITRYGTIAAGEFLAEESRMAELDRVAPRGWERRNIQIVLSTPVIRGSSGPPEIVATYVW